MFPLNAIVPAVQAVLLATDISLMEKIAFRNMAKLLFQDIELAGKPMKPVIVVDKINGDPALIMVVKFHTDKNDLVSYTFQFECWPTDNLQQVQAPWLGLATTIIPKPRMKLSFLAERNSVAYFSQAFEGNFKHCLKNMAQVLGR